jgi:predicted DNA-binding transcriptional regulator YafY
VPLRRADRLFDIIRILRAASQPETAAAIADELEVTVRTVYRDVATLQARRIPIEGAAGVGYVLRRGYELPPLMFYRGRGRGHRGRGALARPPR